MSIHARNNLLAANFAFFALLVVSSAPFFVKSAHADTSFERLSSLLAATPEGGWVKASTNLFSDAWPVGADAVPNSWPGAIVNAWSSFAWDSTRGQMMLWGGGHANYGGNEMYVWDGATGNWARGSLPSRLDPGGFVVDGAAPQSAHTYDNNNYLPINNMFITFGGAAQNGGNFVKKDGTNETRAGPFLWDPDKADPNRVGGTTGSGWNTIDVAQGGNMWIDRQGSSTGSEPPSHVNGTTAYRTENGKDVVYVTGDSNASGFPLLYRYTLGDVRNGGKDTWETVAVTSNSVGYQGSATIDTTHNLYIRTATSNVGPYTADLAIWDLDNSNAANPRSNADIGINLVNSDGSDFVMNGTYGMEYDSANNTLVLWNGSGGGGTVWAVNVLTDADGNVGADTTWTIHELQSSTLSHPHGDFTTGVLGKWHYDPTLGAFVALDQIARENGEAWDAGVWLYKPVVGVVPEPETYALLLAGLGVIGGLARRRHEITKRRQG
jgi:hypothetical protein